MTECFPHPSCLTALGRSVRSTVLALALWAGACGGVEEASTAGDVASRGDADLGGDVISTVDGRPIERGKASALIEQGLTPRRALWTLQAEQLLIGEAERRGFEAHTEVERVGRQAQVQALLAHAVEPQEVSEAELRKAYRAARRRFVQPERRASFHVLVTLGDSPSAEAEARAREFARARIDDLRDTAVERLRERYHDEELEGSRVVAEAVPATSRKGRLVAPYLEAIFSLSQPGVVPGPVRTEFGWHAIRVTEIEPAKDVSFEEARAELREEVLVEKRKRATRELFGQLRRSQPIDVPSRVGEALAAVEP